MPSTKTHTIESLIELYARDIAFVADEDDSPAVSLDEFLGHMYVAGERLEGAGLDEDGITDTAATYLSDASAAEGTERDVLVKYATDYLYRVSDMADEYRGMVGE